MRVAVSCSTGLSPWARWTARFLWSVLWFWMGFRLAIPLLLTENLFLAGAVNVFVALVLGWGFGVVGLSRPSLFRSRAGFWALGYWLITVVSSLVSPFVTQENFLRVFGTLATSGAIIIAMVVFFNIFAPTYALIWAARAYIPGVLLTATALVLTNPSVLALREAGNRFGDPELLHPNSLGFVLGVGVLFLVFLRVYRVALWQSSLALLMILGLLATFSKTAIAGTSVSIALAFWFLHRTQKWRLASLALLGGLAVALFFGDYLTEQVQGYFYSEQATTLSGRTILWSWVIGMVAERPFWGYGYQVMKDLAALDPRLSTWDVLVVHAHNAYLDVLFSSGFLGLAFYLTFWFYSLKLLVAGITRLRRSSLRPYFLSVCLFLIAYSFTEGALNLGFAFWMAVACALALEKSLCGSREL